jgi:hypothetical protein
MSDIIWILKPKKDNLDYIDLVVKISNNHDINLNDYEIGQVQSVVHSFKDEIVKYLLEHGFNSLVSSELLLEHIVAKGTPDNKIIPVIQSYLDKVNVDNELIIVDPYFFAKPKNPNYVNVLDQLLDKYIPTLDNLVIVTNSFAVDATVKSSILSALQGKKATLNIIHKQHNDYHDRYWISGAREKGLVMGTSLNSLGNKVALLDRLNTIDVRSIVKELSEDGLI